MRPVASLALFLAAWGPAAASGAEGGWQFRCPDAGTVVERSGGVARLVFRGADPAVPLVCRSGQRGTTSLVLGLWRMEQPSVQAALEPLRSLFPARPGASVHVQYFRDISQSTVSGFYIDTWRVLGPARVEVPAGRFDAIGFERETVSVSSNARRFQRQVRFWLHATTGAPLKVEHTPLAGRVDPDLPSWEATALRSTK